MRQKAILALCAIGRLSADSHRVAEVATSDSSDIIPLLNAGNDDFDSLFTMSLAGSNELGICDLCVLYAQIGEHMMRTGTQELRGSLCLVIEQISEHMKRLEFNSETAENDVLLLAVIISSVPELREDAEGILRLYLDMVQSETMLSHIFEGYEVASNVPSAFNMFAEDVEVPDWVHDHLRILVLGQMLEVRAIADIAEMHPASRFTLHRAYRDLLAACDVPTLLTYRSASPNFRKDWLRALRARAAEIEALVDETETPPAL